MMGEVNQARDYDVRVLPTSVHPGDEYWRVVEVRHLSPSENRGKHNVFVDVVDGQGRRVREPQLRIGWTWEGRRPDEVAVPQRLDKPDGGVEQGNGNVEINGGQRLRVWILDARPSDAVEGIHTKWPDEPGPGGQKWNSIGHHSFYIRFQLAAANIVGGGDGGGGSTDDGPTIPSESGLVAMVQALQLEVAELRKFQMTVAQILRAAAQDL